MNDVNLIIYPAPDPATAKPFFTALTGAEPYVDSPYYIGYKTGGFEIGLVPQGDAAAPGGLAYWDVNDIAASVKALTDAGGSVLKEPTDVAQGLLVATVREPNGSIVGLRQHPKG